MTQLTLQRQSSALFRSDDEHESVRQGAIGSLVTREWRKVRNGKPPDALCLRAEIFAAIGVILTVRNAELLRAHLTFCKPSLFTSSSTRQPAKVTHSTVMGVLIAGRKQVQPKWSNRSATNPRLLGDFPNCISAASTGRQHGAAFSDGGGSNDRHPQTP